MDDTRDGRIGSPEEAVEKALIPDVHRVELAEEKERDIKFVIELRNNSEPIVFDYKLSNLHKDPLLLFMQTLKVPVTAKKAIQLIDRFAELYQSIESNSKSVKQRQVLDTLGEKLREKLAEDKELVIYIKHFHTCAEILSKVFSAILPGMNPEAYQREFGMQPRVFWSKILQFITNQSLLLRNNSPELRLWPPGCGRHNPNSSSTYLYDGSDESSRDLLRRNSRNIIRLALNSHHSKAIGLKNIFLAISSSSPVELQSQYNWRKIVKSGQLNKFKAWERQEIFKRIIMPNLGDGCKLTLEISARDSEEGKDLLSEQDIESYRSFFRFEDRQSINYLAFKSFGMLQTYRLRRTHLKTMKLSLNKIDQISDPRAITRLDSSLYLFGEYFNLSTGLKQIERLLEYKKHPLIKARACWLLAKSARHRRQGLSSNLRKVIMQLVKNDPHGIVAVEVLLLLKLDLDQNFDSRDEGIAIFESKVVAMELLKKLFANENPYILSALASSLVKLVAYYTESSIISIVASEYDRLIDAYEDHLKKGDPLYDRFLIEILRLFTILFHEKKQLQVIQSDEPQAKEFEHLESKEDELVELIGKTLVKSKEQQLKAAASNLLQTLTNGPTLRTRAELLRLTSFLDELKSCISSDSLETAFQDQAHLLYWHMIKLKPSSVNSSNDIELVVQICTQVIINHKQTNNNRSLVAEFYALKLLEVLLINFRSELQRNPRRLTRLIDNIWKLVEAVESFPRKRNSLKFHPHLLNDLKFALCLTDLDAFNCLTKAAYCKSALVDDLSLLECRLASKHSMSLTASVLAALGSSKPNLVLLIRMDITRMIKIMYQLKSARSPMSSRCNLPNCHSINERLTREFPTCLDTRDSNEPELDILDCMLKIIQGTSCNSAE